MMSRRLTVPNSFLRSSCTNKARGKDDRPATLSCVFSITRMASLRVALGPMRGYCTGNHDVANAQIFDAVGTTHLTTPFSP